MKNESNDPIPLESYLNNGIRNIMANAYKSVLSNPKEAMFVYKMQKVFGKSEKKRKAYKEQENLHIPTFLISSIAADCNLSCKGCYAHANNICGTAANEQKDELTAEQWKQIFIDAAEMGINFNLLAGGEPLLRKDVLKAASEGKDMIFPVFTNGTIMTDSLLDLFSENLNIIPVISLEGGRESTDNRRGAGVYNNVIRSMEKLQSKGLFYGASITVSTGNIEAATSVSYITLLKGLGCKIIFFIEYVPSETGTEHLALDETGIARMATNMEKLRNQFSDIMFLSFPGDEKEMGGCLAAGRGFFHIGPDGSAEACPFSPYSDSNVAQKRLKETLRSPFFAKLRESGLVGGEHTGGCTLFDYEDKVRMLLNQIK
ncbi:MAG: radical SAM protein [Alistipes sp.]|nr:radical SAM protein [Alistipes sp.]